MSGSIASSSYALNATLLNSTSSTTFATTGSNTLRGSQYISSSFVPTNFTDTASLYTDGGIRATRNSYFSSSIYVGGDLVVFGTQSVNYITSSQLNIADNIITVNTSIPAVRFGGIAVQDSGSLATGLTGSLLWDSQNNHWIYTNPSGSSYSGGMMISGPRASLLGEEQGTTFNALMKGQGGDHITSSGIFEVSGNIGIGTSTVTEGTQAASSISIFLSSSVSSGPLIQFPGNGRIRPASTGDRLSIDGNALFLNSYIGGNTIMNTAGGNVGIGTSNPINRLVVSGSGDQHIQQNSSTSSNCYTIYTNSAKSYAAGLSVDVGPHAWIVSDLTAGATRLVITSGGNVGIGTDSPGAKLQVAGTVEANGSLIRAVFGTTVQDSDLTGISGGNGSEVQIQSPSTTRGAFLTLGGGMAFDEALGGIAFYNSNNVDGKRNRAFIVGGQAGATAGEQGSYLSFGTVANTVSVPSERMRITSGGNVGINTISPGVSLHVNGTIWATRIGGTNSTPPIQVRGAGGGPRIQTYGLDADANAWMGLGTDMAGNPYEHSLYFSNAGGGIGRQTIGSYNGTTYTVKMTILDNGSIGAPTGTNIYNPSDVRLKQNVTTITNGLDKVMGLNPVKFNWIEEFSSDEQDKDMLGFIAQEVQNIVPEAVEGFSDGSSITVGETIVENPLRVNEKFIIPVLVKAIQELKAEIEALKNK